MKIGKIMKNVLTTGKYLPIMFMLLFFGKAFNEGQKLAEDMMIKYQKRENINE